MLVACAGVSHAGASAHENVLMARDAFLRFHDHRPQDGPCDRLGILDVTNFHCLRNRTGRHRDHAAFDSERGDISLVCDVQDDSSIAYRRIHCGPFILDQLALLRSCTANRVSALTSCQAVDLSVWVARWSPWPPAATSATRVVRARKSFANPCRRLGCTETRDREWISSRLQMLCCTNGPGRPVS